VKLKIKCPEFLKISNWPFAVKSGVPVSIVSLLCLGLIIVSASMLENQKRVTASIIDKNMTRTTKLAKLAMDVRQVNENLYKTISRQAAEIETNGPDKIIKLQGDVDDIIAGFTAYQKSYGKAGSIQTVNDVIGDLKDFKGILDVIASMLDVDYSSALDFVEPYDTNYRQLIAKIDSLVGDEIAAARNQAATVAQQADDVQRFYQFVSLMALFLVGLIWLFFSRLVTHSVQKIAMATKELAEGNLEVDIDALQRKDELRVIVDSLRFFKENMLKVESMRAEQDSLRERGETEKKAAMQMLADAFEVMVKDIIHALSKGINDM